MTLIAEELTKMSSRELISPPAEIRTDQRQSDKIDQLDKSKNQVQREKITSPNASFDRTHIQRTEPSENIVNPFWFVKSRVKLSSKSLQCLLLHFKTLLVLPVFHQFIGHSQIGVHQVP